MEELSLKKDFTDVYMQESPYNYLKTMKMVEYRIPNETKPLYLSLVDQIYEKVGRPVNILDLGSSYGINSALMTYNLTMEEMDAFFLKEKTPPTTSEVKEFFRNLPKRNKKFNFYQVDISAPALRFSEEVGLCNGSLCVNLETETLRIPKSFGHIDMVIATGCVGYIGYKSFSRLFETFPEPEKDRLDDRITPLFAFSILRMFPIDKIKKTFEHYGFALQKSDIEPMPQRHFYNKDEMNNTISLLKERGLETANLEETGYYYADFYVGTPKEHEKVLTSLIKELETV